MKNGVNINISRRSFFGKMIGSILAIPFIEACRKKIATILLRMTGTSYLLGHRLWIKDFPKPTETIEIPILIVGGGISGLSAARHFAQNKIDFKILELEKNLGGNARNGENKYSKYPLGAHYLPLPNLDDKELLKFLEESKIIVDYRNGIPVFDTKQLSFDPQERLFYNNIWQEDLVPKNSGNKLLSEETQRFFKMMAEYRLLKGKDGKYAFNIPLSESSTDAEILQLDIISMKTWMNHNNFHSEELLWYINYSCRDDYGLGYDSVSAWAGIHYFAGRKNNYIKNADAVLTWPEGNSHLTDILKQYTSEKNINNTIVYNVVIKNNKVITSAYNDISKKSIEIVSDKVLMATPQYINQYLITTRRNSAKDFHYAPWLLATIVIKDLSQNSSFPLSWDNVIYGSKGLGYIFDQQQMLNQELDCFVITYYLPFSSANTKVERKKLYSKSEDYWKSFIINDLKIAHPDIEDMIESIEIFRNGHAMISPTAGFISGKKRKILSTPIENKIFFAHSDLSGISIFEEAFHQGLQTAKSMIS